MLIQTVKDFQFVSGAIDAPSNLHPFGQSLAPKPLIFYVLDDNSRNVSVLDIGFGAGGLGALIRSHAGTSHWAIDGIDGFRPNCLNVNLISQRLYRNIWFGDTRELDPGFLRSYSIICLLDVIEHLDIESAKYVIRLLLSGMRDDAFLFISTPLYFMPQHSFQEGDLEEHLICVPATSMVGLSPTLVCINEPLIAGFVLNKASLATVDLFQPISNRNFDLATGTRVLERCGIPFLPLKVFKY